MKSLERFFDLKKNLKLKIQDRSEYEGVNSWYLLAKFMNQDFLNPISPLLLVI